MKFQCYFHNFFIPWATTDPWKRSFLYVSKEIYVINYCHTDFFIIYLKCYVYYYDYSVVVLELVALGFVFTEPKSAISFMFIFLLKSKDLPSMET